MKRKRPRRSPGRDLLNLVWQAPLLALPIALFFLLTSGERLATFWQFYLISLVFGAASMLGVWFAQHFLTPPLVVRLADDRRGPWIIAGVHVAMALLFGVAGAIALHFTIMPQMLGSARAVLAVLAYFVLFGMLAVGVAVALSFYRKALARAGAERELQLARRIQESFLLSEFPKHPRLELYASNVSSKEVSGDFYDVVPVGDDVYLLAIADVSGKGVPAALLSSMLQASLRTQATSDVRVSAIMARINRLVCLRSPTGQFATFFLAAVSEGDLTLNFTNAGHNFPILFRAGGERRLLETGGLVVGMLEGATYAEESVALAPGDRLLLYTDGVTEAAREDHEMFGEERLMALVDSMPRELPARELVERVITGLREFLGEAEVGDDVTVMALRVAAAGVDPGQQPTRDGAR
ncbi:MAG: hypothetical protein E6K72_02860 [Candidatus Eisenbacteria bacterium]|uniref:PPM-type phosphatase domain-containing protein n=1 Tax=Eiseniibacteriota bacterium TaxID=2212470 RepID=A0A538T3N3_UNCEI|nr:MAG: hypothetical protein E6K72_02860 [Candidatus Eisenbacteria bacterium]